MTRLAAIAVLSALAGPADALEQIPPEAFLDMAAGRTLTFELFGTGELAGTERFLSRSKSIWRQSDGACTYGEITIDGDRLCFLYESAPERGPICWWVFRDGDRIFVRTDEAFGAQIQEVTRISDDPLPCRDIPSA